MTPGVAVSNSSPLIAFWKIDRLELLSQLFTEIVVPAAVRREVAPSLGALPSWIREHQAPKPPAGALLLDPGEREAIALALGLSADFVFLDDLPARRAAARLGMDVIGSADLLLRAREFGLIRAVRPDLDAMLATGLYHSQRVYQAVLIEAGEMRS